MIRAVLVSFLLLSLLAQAGAAAQQSATADSSAAAIQPPIPPSSEVQKGPAVAPPLPGQVTALPAPASPPAAPPPPPLPLADRTSRIPDAPTPSQVPVPSVPLNKNKPVSSTSSTGQFIVHGDDLKLRSAFSSRCDEIANELRQLLRDKEPWVLPVVVLLKKGDTASAGAPPVSATISQISHGGFHLQLNISLRSDLRTSEVRSELVRILLAERILRHQKELSTKRPRLLPDWLYTGTLEAMDYRKRVKPSALFAAIFKSGRIYSIEEIIEASPVQMDALSKSIYQTSCGALVLALLDQPEGNIRLAKFMGALASDERPERDLLDQWFPNFATSPTSLNKWWSLQLASLANPTLAEPLTPTATVKQLESALTIRYRGKASEVPKPRPVFAIKTTPDLPPSAPPSAPLAEAPAPQTSGPSSASAETLAPKPSTPKPAEASAATSLADTAAPDTDAAKEEKLPFLRRIRLFGKRAPTDDEVIEAAMKEAAAAEAKAASQTAATATGSAKLEPAGDSDAEAESRPVTASPTKRQPLFDRWFGNDESKPSASAETTVEEAVATTPPPANPPPVREVPRAAQASTKPSTAPAPKAPEAAKKGSEAEAPEPEPQTAEPAKKSPGFNPLNWLRRGKKDKAPNPEATEDAAPSPKTSARPVPRAAVSFLWAWSPLLGDGVEHLQMQVEAQPAKPVAGFLGFGKKKAKEEAEAAAVQEPKPAVTEKAGSAKPAPAKADKAPAKTEKPVETPAPPAAPTEEAEDPNPSRKRRFPFFGGKNKTADAEEEKAAEPAAQPSRNPAPAVAPKSPAKRPASKPSETSAAGQATVDAAISIEDFGAIMKRDDRREILSDNLNALAALQNRSSVLFRPLVQEYSEIVAGLMEGKTKGVEERLRVLRSRTATVYEQSRAVRDYVDVYEANENPALSGAFDDYLRLPETIQQELPQRTDPISRYLDALDREFSQK